MKKASSKAIAVPQSASLLSAVRTLQLATRPLMRFSAASATLLSMAEPALAQTLKQTGVNIFTVIYSIVGVVGAIACLVTLLNWITGNWLGRDDPKKMFFQSLLGVGLAFSVVAIIQFVKDAAGGSASGISSL